MSHWRMRWSLSRVFVEEDAERMNPTITTDFLWIDCIVPSAEDMDYGKGLSLIDIW
jgi:hypothetical protein